MISLVYELIYVWVVAAGIFSAVILGAKFTAGDAFTLIAILLISGAFTAFKRSGWTVRLIISGVFLTAFMIVFLIMRSYAGKGDASGTDALWTVLIAACVSFAAGELLAAVRVLRVISFAAAVVYLVVLSVFGYETGKLLVSSVLLLGLFCAAEEIQIRWDKAGNKDPRTHFVYIFPFVFLTVLFVTLIPSPEDPYDWQFVRRIYDHVAERFEKIELYFIKGDGFDPSDTMIGFSGRGEVYGNVRQVDTEVMYLTDVPSMLREIRLTGKTFDTFDGRKWTDTDTSELPDEMLDTIAFIASAEEYTDVPVDIARRTTFTVNSQESRSGYVFAPLKSEIGYQNLYSGNMAFFGGDIIWKDESEDFRPYSISFYRMNRGNDIFEDYLRSAGIPSREAFEKAAKELSVNGMNPYFYDDYLEHAENIKAFYTGRPEISEKLRTYMDGLYENASDDHEKMNILCNFLRLYTYTENPGELPDRVDEPGEFLDYLLFESGRGYCTHFATAFVLLARAEGLPARYVQGYAVDTNGERELPVYSSMAHAWPEVYFDGVGWIPYEPTPGFFLKSYWRTEAESEGMYGMAVSSYPGSWQPEEDADLPDVELPVIEEEERKIPVRGIVISVLSGLLFFILCYLAGRAIEAVRFKKKNVNERYEILCRQVLDLLRLLGKGIRQGETLCEFKERAVREAASYEKAPHEEASAEAVSEFEGFIDILSDYLYSDAPDPEAGEKTAVRYREHLLKRLKQENRPGYILTVLGIRKYRSYLS